MALGVIYKQSKKLRLLSVGEISMKTRSISLLVALVAAGSLVGQVAQAAPLSEILKKKAASAPATPTAAGGAVGANAVAGAVAVAGGIAAATSGDDASTTGTVPATGSVP